MLMGIATKNSILLVDYAIMARRDHGMAAGTRCSTPATSARGPSS
jgi:hypothetical protein